MSIKWNLAELMQKKSINNKTLAQRTNFHPVTISNLKRSTTMPDRLEKVTLEKLCVALDCNPSEFFDWEADATIEIPKGKEEKRIKLPPSTIQMQEPIPPTVSDTAKIKKKEQVWEEVYQNLKVPPSD